MALSMKQLKYLYVLVIAVTLFTSSGCNPFSPALDNTPATANFGDPRTIDGYFQAFQYAYQFKDTTLYGTLFTQDFIFSFRDYDRGLDEQWGRDDEVRTTGGLFAATQTLNLLWEDVLDSSSTATTFDITRSFSLDITFNQADIEHVDGRAIFHLIRPQAGAAWQAQSWQDESNF
jgi:hypothetical protein